MKTKYKNDKSFYLPGNSIIWTQIVIHYVIFKYNPKNCKIIWNQIYANLFNSWFHQSRIKLPNEKNYITFLLMRTLYNTSIGQAFTMGLNCDEVWITSMTILQFLWIREISLPIHSWFYSCIIQTKLIPLPIHFTFKLSFCFALICRFICLELMKFQLMPDAK